MDICYHTFLTMVQNAIVEKVEKNISVSITKVKKNNGIELQGIVITAPGKGISPAIYLESFYEEFKGGKDISEIGEEIWKVYEQSQEQVNFDASGFMDFEKAKHRILYKLVNYERNQKLLEQIPHAPFLDLAIVFYYLVEESQMGNAVILIRNEHLKVWEVDQDEVFHWAKYNTPRKMPFEIKRMSELLREMLEEKIRKDVEKAVNCERIRNTGEEDYLVQDILKQMKFTQDTEWESPMFVLSNDQKSQGAACILYPDILKNIGRMLERDFYILPSSVHEVIVLPIQRETQPEQLQCMVQEVNESQVPAEDLLSDHVYYYSRERAQLQICR